jgi:hypothetical protein
LTTRAFVDKIHTAGTKNKAGRSPAKKQHGSRYWMVIDPVGELVCLTVYKKGAMEVVRRLAA